MNETEGFNEKILPVYFASEFVPVSFLSLFPLPSPLLREIPHLLKVIVSRPPPFPRPIGHHVVSRSRRRRRPDARRRHATAASIRMHGYRSRLRLPSNRRRVVPVCPHLPVGSSERARAGRA